MAGLTKEEVRADAPLPQVECLALLVLADPIRENAVETLAYFHAQGVSLKLISGDDPLTASAVAAQAGLPDAERYIDTVSYTHLSPRVILRSAVLSVKSASERIGLLLSLLRRKSARTRAANSSKAKGFTK